MEKKTVKLHTFNQLKDNPEILAINGLFHCFVSLNYLLFYYYFH